MQYNFKFITQPRLSVELGRKGNEQSTIKSHMGGINLKCQGERFICKGILGLRVWPQSEQICMLVRLSSTMKIYSGKLRLKLGIIKYLNITRCLSLTNDWIYAAQQNISRTRETKVKD